MTPPNRKDAVQLSTTVTVAGESTALLLEPSSPSSPSSNLSIGEASSSRSRRARASSIPSNHQDDDTSTAANARRILLSTTLSRFGSRSWEFATPLLLLEWMPGSLAAPAAFGLAATLSTTVVSPVLGSRADARWDRMTTVAVGMTMQAFGCLLSVAALFLRTAWVDGEHKDKGDVSGTNWNVFLLVLAIIAGVIEALGAQLSSVSVKKEWVPIVSGENSTASDEDDPENENTTASRSFLRLQIPSIDLSFMNTAMSNIDLIAAMFGPFLAGWIIEFLGHANGKYSSQRGFAAVAFMNVFSFLPEVWLLGRVYRSCPALQQRPTFTTDNGESGSEVEGRQSKPMNSWKVWYQHPSGLPLLTVSMASLYLTALSSHGVVLTAYLVAIGLSPSAIGIFRGIGSFSGVVGICLFSFFRNLSYTSNHGVDTNTTTSRAEASASMRSIEQLRRVSMGFLLLEVVAILVATLAFSLFQDSSLFVRISLSSAPDLSDHTGSRLPWQILLFLSAIVVSRAGLYAFDVGVLEIEQYVVDERYRNAVGSVEGALCSVAEMGMYVLSLVLPDPTDFGWQVGVSAMAVSCGGVCFGSFLCLYHMHLHHHCDGNGHNHHHAHTWQQEKDLREYGYHVHLHRSKWAKKYL